MGRLQMANILRESGKVSVVFLQLTVIFTTCLIAANIFETKEIAVGGIALTGGLLIFPLTYVICRIVCEIWGFQRASLLIWPGFLMNYLKAMKYFTK